MSSQFTTTQIQERFESLPDDMKAVVSGEETAQQIQEIGRRHGLRIDNIGILIEYSGLIMLGLIKTDEFVSSLESQMGVSTEQAEQLAIEVDSQVFSRMRNSLRQTQYQSTADKRFNSQEATSQTSVNISNDSVIDAQIPKQNTTADVAPVSVTVNPEPMTANAADEAIPGDLQGMMSGGDYNPNDFEVTASPSATAHQTVEEVTPQTQQAQPPKVGGDVDMSAFELDATAVTHHSASAPVDIPIQTSNQNSHDTYAQNERQAQKTAAQDIVSSMPGAVGEVYKEKLQQNSATPAPSQDPVKIQDFRSRLQEKMAAQDNSTQNTDPYRESID